MSVILRYDNNNSGGKWWLTDHNWEALEDAGWTVGWVQPKEDGELFGSGRQYFGDTPADILTPLPHTDAEWLGAHATTAAKRFDTPEEGVAEWERITGQSASDVGCGCCGPPHGFDWVDEDTGEHHYANLEITGSLSL